MTLQSVCNSIEAAAATLGAAAIAYVLFLPDTYERGEIRVAEQQFSTVVWGGIAGAIAYYGWRSLTKTL
jgi:hypothetical protein